MPTSAVMIVSMVSAGYVESSWKKMNRMSLETEIESRLAPLWDASDSTAHSLPAPIFSHPL
jgi:hypothetical protein